METFNTMYGNITLYSNETYITPVFRNDKGYWDIDTLLQLKKYIRSDKNILEIGGHCGTSSIIYSSFLNDDQKVFVYEPQKNMYNLLVKNINQNNLQHKIKPYNLGVFCYNGHGKMNCIDIDGGGGDVAKRYNEEINLPCNFGGIGLGGDGEVIELVTIDSMNLDNIGYIHCDAQGAENFIFSGGIETINKNRPVIYYEDNENCSPVLYNNVCKSYPQYRSNSKFDIKKYCIEELKYSEYILNFNGGQDTLLIPSIDLSLYEKRIFSQNGEDGITIKLLELIYHKSVTDTNFYVEFGVESGVQCNTRILRENYKWKGLMMDGSNEKLDINLKKEFITKENICELFEKHNVSTHINLLSVDIDFNDYYVLKEILPKYKCDIIICEYNATHLANEDKVVKYDKNGKWDTTNYFGASLLAFNKLATHFNYTLVYCENKGVNCFFVHNDIIQSKNIQFLNAGNVEKIYRKANYGRGPNGGHMPDPLNRNYVSFNYTTKFPDIELNMYPFTQVTQYIPNIAHFVFGLKPQEEEFLFVYYLAVYSCLIVNNPDTIYFYYHYNPYGKWWEELKSIKSIQFIKIDIPTHIGKKEIKKTAHMADKVRMDVLYEKGGIYFDIDTICVKPYAHLLTNKVVLGKEVPTGICNAIMMTEKNSDFFKIWLENYEEHFNSYGWGEASIILPCKLAEQYPELLNLQEADVFFLPTWTETDRIFEKIVDIPSNLITLHLWETMSINYINQIKGWDWANTNADTLYGKIMLYLKNYYNFNT